MVVTSLGMLWGGTLGFVLMLITLIFFDGLFGFPDMPKNVFESFCIFVLGNSLLIGAAWGGYQAGKDFWGSNSKMKQNQDR